MTVASRRWPAALAAAVLVAAIAARIAAASRPGLWVDEIFSLAMATGHSLEHSAATAQPALGDFVQPPGPEPSTGFRRYLEHDHPPAGAGRVVRAVLLSDTSPPLYYLLLNGWTRALGTGDQALRLLSVLWAVLALALLWRVGTDLGGTAAGWTAALLFALSPVALYYSAEGRMYSLLWFLALALAWLTLGLAREPPPFGRSALWVAASAAGLLAHYFFAFAWVACAGWLLLHGTRAGRGRLAILAGTTLALVLPWLMQVPHSLARWRVSDGWLQGGPVWPDALAEPFALAGSLLAGTTALGGWRWADDVTIAVLLLVAVWLVLRGLARPLVSVPARLFWGCLAAACAGPLVFDLLRDTATAAIPRYALPGLPAAVLLTGWAMSRLPHKLHAAALAAIALAWLPADRALAFSPVPRPGQPFAVIGSRLNAWVQPGDLVLVHSIPSGVLGVARYGGRELPLLAWVPQLGVRDTQELAGFLRGRRRLALVRIHDLSEAAAPERWLREHARLTAHEEFRRSRAQILYFAPLHGETFAFTGDGVTGDR